MAYPYPVQRYRSFQGWIPVSDIDGIDSKEEYMADVENVNFNNGFFCNAVKPVESLYDLEVTTLQGAGFKVISIKDFYHTDRGDCTFYLMYKLTGGIHHELVYLVKDKDGYTQLRIDEQSQDVTIQSEPTNVNYSYVNGQLKINLNVIGIYNQIFTNATKRSVYLNLSLDYLTRRMYNAVSIATAERSEGWYLFPRYLGWSYGDNPGMVNNDLPVSKTTLDFEGSLGSGLSGENIVYSAGVTLNNTDVAVPPGGGTQYCKLAAVDNHYTINDADRPSKVRFLYYANGWTVRITARTATKTLATKLITGWAGWISDSMDIPGNVDDVSIEFKVIEAQLGATTQVYFDNIEIEYGSIYEYALIAKYSDNQRGLLEFGSDTIFNDGTIGEGTVFKFKKEDIDWIVIEYEVYVKQGDGLYYKYVSMEVNGGVGWTEPAGYYQFTPLNIHFSDLTKSGIETLNANYGLNYNVKAYKEDLDEFGFSDTYLVGSDILQEITYRHRQYFVNGDEKLYMSHIAGSGLNQPDSFPYNEDVSFGYLITDENAKNIALAITPLDEITIYGRDKSYVYYMQFTNSTIVRKIKAVNGGVGVTSAKALALDSTGHSLGMNLFWIDVQGAYLYAGGREAPRSVSNATHRNYWLQLSGSDKDNAIVTYNRNRREYWITFGDNIIIYEAMYNRFMKYKFDFTIREFIGTKGSKFYMLGADGKLYVIDYDSEDRLDAKLRTHSHTNTLIIGQYPISSWEWQHKILQDLYVAMKTTQVGDILTYTIIPDKVSMTAIKFPLAGLREVVPSPLLVRYGMIAVELNIPATLACVKEFGYSFSVPSQGVGDLEVTKAQGIGQSVGTQLGVGQ